MTRAKVGRCQSCRWWERSSNFRAISRDWGLCHLWGGNSGSRLPGGFGFIDYSYGHEPRGADTCDHYNTDPKNRDEVLMDGKMPDHKCEGELP